MRRRSEMQTALPLFAARDACNSVNTAGKEPALPKSVYVFDAYGTLFDVNSAARTASKEPDFPELAAHWPTVAANWRRKQLEYTWLRAVAGRHCDFEQVTKDGLDWALEAAKLTSPALRARLLALYWELDAYPEVPTTLAKLKAAGAKCAILSNGTPAMLAAAVTSAEIAPYLDAVLSVETVGVYKPHAKVYDMVGQEFGCANSEVLFVSSNGWDAAGGAGYGFEAAWVNRAGDLVDKSYATPHHILSDLTTIPDLT